MRPVKLYEVKVRDVMAFDHVDIYHQSMPIERLAMVRGSDEVLFDREAEKISLPVYTVNEFTNGIRSEDFLAIHPNLSKLLIPNILNESCADEHKRACKRVKYLDEKLTGACKELSISYRDKEELRERIIAIGSLSFFDRLKFLFTGRSEYL